jgi:hypothetical protein
VVGGHDEDQLVEQAGREALLARSQPVTSHDAEVELVGAEPFLDHP